MALRVAELATFTTTRGQLKAKLTRVENFLKTFTDNDSINLLNARITGVESALKEFDVVQSQIEAIDENSSGESERDLFENRYYYILATVQDIKDRRASVNDNVENQNSNSHRHSFGSDAPPVPEIALKLPALNLPSFEGNYSDWLSFYDIFNSLIHENNTLSSCQKFHYLKSCVKGDAAHAIESLTISNANYLSAFEILKNRYNNKRLIVQEHVCAILKSEKLNKPSYLNLRRLLNDIKTNTEALKVLNIPVNSWDALIVPIIIEKLDYNTNKDWQSTLNSEIPKLNSLIEFLDHKCQLLESLSQINSKSTNNDNNSQNVTKNPNKNKTYNNYNKTISNVILNNKPVCNFCKDNSHTIYKCKEFLKLSVSDRMKHIKNIKACFNCLKQNHFSHECHSTFVCRDCKLKHNTLLHEQTDQMSLPVTNAATAINSLDNNCTASLLSTAVVQIKDKFGKYHDCRALLDVGSQSNIITYGLCKRLKLNLNNINIPIAGINCAINNVNKKVNIEIKSKNNNFTAKLDCLVLSRITENLPVQSFNKYGLNIPKSIKLADPYFNKRAPIDLLVGAELFWKILCNGNVKAKNGQPHFQETELGWVVGGPVNMGQKYSCCNLSVMSTTTSLQKQVAKLFWEIDEPSNQIHLSSEENECENYYKETTKRGVDGRFIVSLPFKTNVDTSLGESKNTALKRFFALENKLNKQPNLKQDYQNFINEYLSLDHMELISKSDNVDVKKGFYLPHHAVIKESSLTTKLRVVFDASCKTSTGVSLNDMLMIGPTIQQDLFSITIRFRTHKFVLTADITKMYRQILIDSEQRDFQRILWRDDKSKPVQSFRLKTVTYGTAPASWLAVRTLFELAEQEKVKYPQAYQIIKDDFYMDDLLTGCDNIKDAIIIRDELIDVMRSGGFELCKWASNHSQLLPDSENMNVSTILNLNRDSEIKTLGLVWDSKADILKYSVELPDIPKNITKRHILSFIAHIFDPLGLINPVIIKAKIILQKIWILKIDWDEIVPTNICEEWLQLVTQFSNLEQIKIPRKVISNHPAINIELHGFCDASQEAYGAVIYIRCSDEFCNNTVELLCAKSRVAPIKTVSIPRLELCGALLLSRLANKVSKAININISNRYMWTDSSIALAWISAPASSWQTFVANRVSEIQDLTKSEEWLHINSEFNPADILSRGASLDQLNNANLWWSPEWLKLDSQLWPKSKIQAKNLETPEKRKHAIVSNVMTQVELPLFSKFSSFNKLQRVIAYILRFKNNCKNKNNKLYKTLSCEELNMATECILRHVQRITFTKELKELKINKNVNRQSSLFRLNPILDKNGLIRVGGRLKNANLKYNNKFPIALPAKHHITKLLIIREHERQLHSGAQATLYALRENYWPIAGRNVVRFILHKCVKCFRANPISQNQVMGDLPASRVTPTRPFSVCGVDYAGPILIKQGAGRGRKTIKTYIALFICFSTKAVHLELVGDCTAEAFLGALKRFMARRGKVLQMHSDNGTNFVGANRELNALKELFTTSNFQTKIVDELASAGIKWNFIPARSPHRGGLWEAGVKQVKVHLNRVIGNTLLTYEELYTLLTQIEACLNSRPITPLSSDPNDLIPLTPGHFLIGDRLMSNPEPELTAIQVNRLSRWQHIEQMKQHFWRRWQREYLTNLQQRSKWVISQGTPLEPGVAVLLVEDNLPPLTWRMGRITAVHPGKDNIVRTVSVKTNNGVVTRAVNKICVLPVNDE